MKRLRNPRTGIAQGDVEVFADYVDHGPMWTGSGDRERRKKVKFNEEFGSPPVVQVSIRLWDMDTNAAIRAEIFADNITEKGFEVVFRTWADSRIARLRASWVAMGELPFEDDWADVL